MNRGSPRSAPRTGGILTNQPPLSTRAAPQALPRWRYRPTPTSCGPSAGPPRWSTWRQVSGLSFLPLSHVAERGTSDQLPQSPSAGKRGSPGAWPPSPRTSWTADRQCLRAPQGAGEAPGGGAREDRRGTVAHATCHRAGTPNWAATSRPNVSGETTGSVGETPPSGARRGHGRRIRREIGLDRAHIPERRLPPSTPTRSLAPCHRTARHRAYGETEVCGPTTWRSTEDNRVGTEGGPCQACTPAHRRGRGDPREGRQRVAPGISTTRRAPPNCSTPRVGCTRVTWEPSIPTVTPPDGSEEGPHHHRRRENIAPEDIEMDLKSHPLVESDRHRRRSPLPDCSAGAGRWGPRRLAHQRGKVADYEELPPTPISARRSTLWWPW